MIDTQIRNGIFGLRVQNIGAFLVIFVRKIFVLSTFSAIAMDNLNTLSCLSYAVSHIFGLKTSRIFPSILKLKTKVSRSPLFDLFSWLALFSKTCVILLCLSLKMMPSWYHLYPQ